MLQTVQFDFTKKLTYSYEKLQYKQPFLKNKHETRFELRLKWRSYLTHNAKT
jgi:hypothetical protein